MNQKKDESNDTLSYPRTGKRGVPQQFPRRLYTMLESESILILENNYPLIQWSESGQAFRINDIEKFSAQVLPKYFRTSKFSSFQRNLNLVSSSLLDHLIHSFHRSVEKKSFQSHQKIPT